MQTKISKDEALKLINENISRFRKILAGATYGNLYDEAHKLAYGKTETLLIELFSKDEIGGFRMATFGPSGETEARPRN